MNDYDYENMYNEEDSQRQSGYSISDSARNLKSNIDNVRDIASKLNNRKEEKIDHEDAQNISERINSTKGHSLYNNNVNPSDINSSVPSSSSLAPKRSIDDGASTLKGLDAAKNASESTAKTAKAAKNTSDAAKAGRTLASAGGKAAGASAAGATAGGASAAGGAAATGAAAAGGMPVIAIVLLAALGIILIFLIVLFISDFTNNNLAMKYGLTNEEAYNTFSEDYKEGMSRYEINNLYEKGNFQCGELSFWNKLGIAFGNYNLKDANQMCKFIKDTLEDYEEKNVLVSPGYIFSALYYAYDTQNTNENGELYLSSASDKINNYEVFQAISDMDIITSLFTFDVLENTEELKELFENNVLSYQYKTTNKENNQNNNESEDENESANENENENEKEKPKTCSKLLDGYEVDNTKLKLYLLYGQEVSSAYEKEATKTKSYNMSDENCRESMEKPGEVDLSIYEEALKQFDYDNNNSYPSINVNGTVYTYKDGFIFQKYPRYAENNINGKRISFNSNNARDISKEIDEIMTNIESRQDYTNYVLGYPSNLNASSVTTCNYNVGGIDSSKLMVKLTHARFNDALPGIEANADIEGQELVDFEKYILGVVYAENGTGDYEALKAQAVAARTFILANINGKFKTYQDGENTVIVVSNSTYDQTYCDPDLGCERFLSSNCLDGVENGCNVTLLTAGTVPSGYTPNASGSKPLSQDSKIRQAVNEVEGQYLVDSQGNAAKIGYGVNEINTWNTNKTDDYVELLRKSYGNEVSLSSGVCTTDLEGGYIANVTYLSGSFKNQITYFNQKDYAEFNYGSYGTIRSHGCGPTSMSIVLSSFTGKMISPVSVTNWACDHKACSQAGTYGGRLFCPLAEEYGLQCEGPLDATSQTNQQKVINALSSGNSLIITGAASGYFTTGGHFIVLTGIDNNGNVSIADPNSREKSNNKYSFNFLIDPSKGHLSSIYIISE